MTRTKAQDPTAADYALTIRPATAADSAALRRLAQLDSAPALAGEVLLAECGNEAVAAIGIASGSVVADPFRRTAEISSILVMRRRDLAGQGTEVPWWRRGARATVAAQRPGLARTKLDGAY